MDSRATGDTFFIASGSSPPSGGGHALKSNDVAPLEGQALPPQLIEELAALLASALVADIRQFPNLAEIHTNHDATVESPPGHDRMQGVGARTRQPASRSPRRPRTSLPTVAPPAA